MTTTNRKTHRAIGWIMLLPFIAWSATAVFFLLRPAYDQAYAPLPVRTYSLVGSVSGPAAQPLQIVPSPDWQEFRYLRSILGDHLLVRSNNQWQHLRAETGESFPQPDTVALKTLLEDAFTADPIRYGNIIAQDGLSASTDTGVNLQLYWESLSIQQEGRDTRWINRVYSIHYLEWTGIAVLDRVLGLFGLFLLMLTTWTGARLLLGSRRSHRKRR